VQFTDGRRSIFTEPVLRRVAGGWVKNLQETEDEGRRLFEEHYFSLRYEDLLDHPYDEIQKLWEFLGAKADRSMEKKILEEMASPIPTKNGSPAERRDASPSSLATGR
jgi:hypothetical protein